VNLTPEQIRAVIVRTQPREWRPNAYGFVFLAEDGSQANDMQVSIYRWADNDGLPMRAPHYTAARLATAGNELDKAIGGFLVMDEFTRFDDHDLYNIDKVIVNKQLAVVVIGIENMASVGPSKQRDLHDAVRKQADWMQDDLKLVTMSDFGEAPRASSKPDVELGQALAAINKHRRKLGMSKLDPVAADWTEEDILVEARRIRRLPNPTFDRRWRLLR
jgi:hypothetical protein